MKQIQEWLGHSDFSTTANIYAHLDYSSKLTSADAMLNGLGFAANWKRKASSRKNRLLAWFLAETVGFEPTDPCGSTDFEGRETAKTALYFHISSYRLSAKSLVNKGFSCILWLWRFFFLQPCFSRPGTIWAPLQGHNKYDLSNINQKRTKVKWKKYTLWFLIF